MLYAHFMWILLTYRSICTTSSAFICNKITHKHRERIWLDFFLSHFWWTCFTFDGLIYTFSYCDLLRLSFVQFCCDEYWPNPIGFEENSTINNLLTRSVYTAATDCEGIMTFDTVVCFSLSYDTRHTLTSHRATDF